MKEKEKQNDLPNDKIGKRKKTIYEMVFKRFFDFFLSLLAIIVLSPVFLILIIASQICIGGNPFFCQYRPGKNGKLFKLIKFRSMTNKTDENGNLLPDKDRITKFGKFIRKTSLDELPQLFNILVGDMAIVGPRPRIVRDVIFYDKDAMSTYSIRPGLTGKSQIAGGRSSASWETIFEIDLQYMEKITLWGDLKIIFKTVGVLFKSDAASEGGGSGKREYYYSDYLLKKGAITEKQYQEGIALATQVIENKGKVEFVESLHN